LTVSEDRGRVLVNCHAGCPQPAVLEALAEYGLWPSSNGDKPKPAVPPRTPEKRYAYVNGAGEIVAFHCRQDLPNGKKGMPWRKANGEMSHGDVKPEHLPLYRLTDVLAASIEALVIVVEGEKCADAAQSLGYVAVSLAGGASQTDFGSALAPLTGRNVCLFPDNDDAGRGLMQRVGQAVTGVARSVSVVTLPNLPVKGDIVDWIAAGGTADGLKQLMVNDAVAFEAWLGDQDDQTQKHDHLNSSQIQNDKHLDHLNPSQVITLTRMDTVQREEVKWLWDPRIPSRKVTIAEGDPGDGKSYLSAAIATAVSLGSGLPGGEQTEPADVIILTAEDGLADTLKGRLEDMGADCSRIHAFEGPATLDDDGFAQLEEHLANINPALVVLDPFQAYTGADLDIHRANQTRTFLSRLAALASKYHCAILIIRHITKGTAGKSIYRGLGSIDITAAARSVLLIAPDPDNKEIRIISHHKMNLAAKAPNIGYRIDNGQFTWVTDVSDISAAELLAADDTSRVSALEEAKAFLQDVLADGPRLTTDVQEDAKALGITQSTLRRARERLGVVATSKRVNGKSGIQSWYWALPPDPQKGLGDQDDQLSNSDHLNDAQIHNEPKTGGLGDQGVTPTPAPNNGLIQWTRPKSCSCGTSLFQYRRGAAPTTSICSSCGRAHGETIAS
jgi:RecA-family ATPase